MAGVWTWGITGGVRVAEATVEVASRVWWWRVWGAGGRGGVPQPPTGVIAIAGASAHGDAAGGRRGTDHQVWRWR